MNTHSKKAIIGGPICALALSATLVGATSAAELSNADFSTIRLSDKAQQTLIDGVAQRKLAATKQRESSVLDQSLIQVFALERNANKSKSLSRSWNQVFQREANGDWVVDVQLHVLANVALLEQHGLTVRHYAADTQRAVVSGSADQLESLASSQWATKIQPVLHIERKVWTGSLNSEGDAALRADRARSRFGVDGSGVRVCVISDGIEGADLSAASGDLPATIDLCPLNDNSGAEGTAMLEIVHDLAPGAQLGFCPAFGNGEPGLAAAVDYLANDAFGGQGCDVIVDDVAILTEAYFQDGIVAQAVDRADQNGVAYFSSAGNGAQEHYQAFYRDTDFFDDSTNLHDFGRAAGGDSEIAWPALVAGNGNFAAAFLQWDEALGQAGDNFNLFIADANGVLAGNENGQFPVGGIGVALQDGDDDPLEIAFVVNQTAQTQPFFILVDRPAGANGGFREIEINFNGELAVDPRFNVEEGSIWGHAAALGANAIAAIDVSDPGLNDIQSFSSRGPSTVNFTVSGQRRFDLRLKPDFTAIDGVSVTGNGGFPTTFFGTSAAAPHAAAIAALLLDRNPALTPDDVRDVLFFTARSRGNPFTFGSGLVDANRAVRISDFF